jgi:glycosyltransferase involved in cell wall biosynthesis
MSGPRADTSTGDANSDVWLIVPCFNEQPVIADVLNDALSVFPNVVCVDDGSTDGSRREIDSTRARRVSHAVNLGQGAALQTGIEYARARPGARYFVTFDADGQHSVHDAARMVQRLRAEPLDMVLGTRFGRGASSQVPLVKRILLRTAVAVGPTARRLGLTDVHNGLRAFNRTVAEQVNLVMSGMGHAGEFTAKAVQHGWRVAEEPVSIEYTEYSMAKGQSVLNSVNIAVDHLVHRRVN